MGTKYGFTCNKCGYSVMSSGEHDFGMLAVTDTYLCKKCKIIADLNVGIFGATFSKEEALVEKEKSGYNLDFYICPKCKNDTNLVKWDKNLRPCPKCDGKMEKDPNGPVIMWD